MSAEYQIEIPPSFLALYTDGRQRLTVPLSELRARYEVCEDLAQHLVERSRALYLDLGITEEDVLLRCGAGLLSADAGLSRAEAVWVVRRLAELLDWPVPPELLEAAG